MTDMLRDLWYFAANSAELKRGGHFRREILGEPVMLARGADGIAFALRDVCPHRAVPLSAGKQQLTGGAVTIECPYHGWRYGVDGVCKLIPSLAEGQSYEVERIRVRRYPTHEAHGMVFVYMAADARSEDVAPPPELDAPDAQPNMVVGRIFNADIDNSVVGLMDPAHVPYVHNQWWWRPPSAGRKLKEKAFVPRELGWGIAKHAPASNSLAYRWLFGGDVTTEIVFKLPGYRWEVVEAGKKRLYTLTCLTPVNETSTRITQMVYWTNAGFLDLMKPILYPAARKFLDQDGRMVDLQNEGLAHTKSMLWIDDIDVQAKWYLKLKKEWAASRAEKRDFVNPIEPTTLRWMS
ncbi:MAG: aromatic ring-hydroxylating dioxygenase subunit alpha [Hyphomonadaceae bacterium]|nr:aromatic ring-hydroxylating dioxygenase subunit alpha [Hyphomonadaceae bacterium]